MNNHEYLIEVCAASILTKRECRKVQRSLMCKSLVYQAESTERPDTQVKIRKTLTRSLAFAALRPQNRM